MRRSIFFAVARSLRMINLPINMIQFRRNSVVMLCTPIIRVASMASSSSRGLIPCIKGRICIRGRLANFGPGQLSRVEKTSLDLVMTRTRQIQHANDLLLLISGT